MTTTGSTTNSPNEESIRQKTWLSIAILVGACLFAFGQTARFNFVLYDDGSHTYDNPYLNPLTWHSFVHIWTHAYDRLYIPLSYTVYGGLVALAHIGAGNSDTGARLNPHVFHVANIVLHVANSLLVYFLLRRFSRTELGSFAGALLFAVHPLQVESVAWISELRGLLSATFGLSAVLIYTRSHAAAPPRRMYAIASLLMLASLLSKPSAVVFPLIAIIVDAALNRRAAKSYIVDALPWLILAVLIAIVTGGQRSNGLYATIPPFQRTFVAGDAIAFYLDKLLWPVHLAIDYGRTPFVALADSRVYVEWLLPPAIAAACWTFRRRAPWLSVGALVSLAALLPVLGLVPFTFQYYSTVADRYAYVAMFGASIILTGLVSSLSRWPVSVILGAIGVSLVLTSARCADWRDTQTLMTAQLAVNSQSVFAHDAFGHIEERSGNDIAALAEYRDVIAERVDLASGHYNVGRCLAALGDPQKAQAEFITAIQMDPSYALPHQALARLLAAEGHTADASTELAKARALDPRLR